MDNLKISNIPDELMLILQLLNNDSKVISEEDFDGVDWELFLQLAIHHRLFPLLYMKISRLKCEAIPIQVIDSLGKLYRKNTFRMLHLCGVLEKVSKVFAENNIRFLLLKGPTLAQELYGDISLRTCGDLDILVPIEDLEKVENLILAQGYEKDGYIQTLLNDWKWRHHHFTYYHKSDGTKIEIHWRLNPSPSIEPSFDELWKRKRESSLVGSTTYVLGKEDQILALVTHGARHAWSRLRWLMDIHQLLNMDQEWGTVINHLRKYQCDTLGGQSFILSNQLFKTSVPNEILSTINKKSQGLAQKAVFYMERMVNLHTDPVPADIANYHKGYLFSLMSRRQKAIYALSILHPFYTDVETLPLPKNMHFMYFPLRPFLWIWRKTRRHAIS
ncbi:Uncharacterised protein [Bacillus freudenreichii]|nr:Uncharacterised protein [Bacillus freudenreichii]